ncbi:MULTISPECIES: ATP-dependent endonuclease [unclassified Planococcus (in: firmicutes)]|uniref:ATP-dependent nuclease n=1 Tax=unclassified Planococcus (in: firmicutes) TaxID=2662419 RepID=UPI000C7AA824|nr:MULTISPECIES: AAA family ATPase [unclassified Planococcus (in: firmicutes)]PKG45434.1 ATP-dependent endonuclease [Planococcus sp. Urea-trap-24]PKG88970.1 ATP-dependent endonuclease [Planococcus sp. Urea-3u-39]PKH36338.1 ATP-dependent endonuclease [Planococcus sp. MB-3u-09]
MKLKKLRVSNFRGIGGDADNPGIEIDFEDIDLVFLIGQNNTGKSSILHAYEYFVLSKIESKFSDFHKRNLNPITIEGWIQTESDEDREHLALVKSVDDEGVARFRKIWGNIGEGAQKYTYNVETAEWRPGGAGGFDSLLQNACPEPMWLRGLDGVDIILEKVQKLIKEKVIDQASEMQRFITIKDELEALRTEIIQADYSRKLETRLNDMMQETFPDLSVSLFGDQKEDIAKKLYTFIQTDINFSNGDGFAVDMNNHGHGIRRQFLFNSLRGLNHVFNELDKTKAQRNSEVIDNIEQGAIHFRKKMLLIEEPELFLHPQSVRMFSKTLHDLVNREGGNPEFQIIAATHSPILIDLSKDHTTLLKTHIDNQGAVCLNQVKSSIFDDEEKERLKMLNTFNPYVCEAFFNDNVILVEGDTEAIIFRELLNKFVEHGKINLSNVPLIVNCGTKNNIPSFQKVLGHFDICYNVIHDLDYTYKENGSRNSAWTLNQTIHDEIDSVNDCLKARRYVMERNFEDAHGYSHSSSLGKPLSAYRLVQGWDIDDTNIKAIEALMFCLEYDASLDVFDEAWVTSRSTSPPGQASTSV